MGGVDAVVAKAQGYLDDGDLRFAAQLLNHAVFAEPDHAGRQGAARRRPTNSSGYGAENGTWRNFYLIGATELRNGASCPLRSRTSAPAWPAP